MRRLHNDNADSTPAAHQGASGDRIRR